MRKTEKPFEMDSAQWKLPVWKFPKDSYENWDKIKNYDYSQYEISTKYKRTEKI